MTGGLAYGEIEHLCFLAGSDGVAPNEMLSRNTFVSRALRARAGRPAPASKCLAGNVTGKIEYPLHRFRFRQGVCHPSSNATPLAVNFNSRITEDIVRVGINYKFDPNAEAPVYQPARSAPVKPAVAHRHGPAQWAVDLDLLTTGINAGYVWASRIPTLSSMTTPSSVVRDRLHLCGQGLGFGVQTGYNFQLGNWVWGIEADAQLSGQRNDPQRCLYALQPGGAGDRELRPGSAGGMVWNLARALRRSGYFPRAPRTDGAGRPLPGWSPPGISSATPRR